MCSVACIHYIGLCSNKSNDRVQCHICAVLSGNHPSCCPLHRKVLFIDVTQKYCSPNDLKRLVFGMPGTPLTDICLHILKHFGLQIPTPVLVILFPIQTRSSRSRRHPDFTIFSSFPLLLTTLSWTNPAMPIKVHFDG